MRIALLHHWSRLGAALAAGLLRERRDEVWLVGSAVPRPERDATLLAEVRRAGARTSVVGRAGRRFAAALDAFAPDLVVVATWPTKLAPTIARCARLAALNVHASLLPAWRGPMPEHWALRSGATATGVTIHHLVGRFDAGPIVAQAPVPIPADDTLLALAERMEAVAPPLLGGLVERYRGGERPAGDPQDEARASWAPMIREADLAIDWRASAVTIDRLVRASWPFFAPWAAFAGLGRVPVAAVRRTSGPIDLGPGELAVDPAARALLVGTGEGALELVTVGGEPGCAFARRHGLA